MPAVLGAVRFNILTIGITNDESKANAMLVRGDKFDAIKADPKLLKGQRLLLTTNSTVDYRGAQMSRKIRARPERHAVRQSRSGPDHHRRNVE